MAGQLVRGGGTLDIPSADEIRQVVGEELRQSLRGVKYMRLPILTGTPSGNALILGGHANRGGFLTAPAMGYAWVITHLWIKGLTTGTTPDIMNVIVNSQTWWQLNGNNFAYVFNPGQMVLQQGEALAVQNQGNLVATGQIQFGGAMLEVPGEMLGKLVAG